MRKPPCESRLPSLPSPPCHRPPPPTPHAPCTPNCLVSSRIPTPSGREQGAEKGWRRACPLSRPIVSPLSSREPPSSILHFPRLHHTRLSRTLKQKNSGARWKVVAKRQRACGPALVPARHVQCPSFVVVMIRGRALHMRYASLRFVALLPPFALSSPPHVPICPRHLASAISPLPVAVAHATPRPLCAPQARLQDHTARFSSLSSLFLSLLSFASRTVQQQHMVCQ